MYNLAATGDGLHTMQMRATRATVQERKAGLGLEMVEPIGLGELSLSGVLGAAAVWQLLQHSVNKRTDGKRRKSPFAPVHVASSVSSLPGVTAASQSSSSLTVPHQSHQNSPQTDTSSGLPEAAAG